jgi:hypothetical protein
MTTALAKKVHLEIASKVESAMCSEVDSKMKAIHFAANATMCSTVVSTVRSEVALKTRPRIGLVVKSGLDDILKNGQSAGQNTMEQSNG